MPLQDVLTHCQSNNNQFLMKMQVSADGNIQLKVVLGNDKQ